MALALLTRLPAWRIDAGGKDAALARALWAYPLVGALVGGISGASYMGAIFVGLPLALAALVALSVSVLVTGCFHEDGLADFCDGIGGGRDRARKLEIMRDSRIGTYGATALILSFLMRTTALMTLQKPLLVLIVLIAAGMIGRACIAIPLVMLKPARMDGMGSAASSPPWPAIAAALLFGIGAALLLGEKGMFLLASAMVAAMIITLIARRYLGGYTGDVLGASALSAEVAALLFACSRWGFS
ncbi:MAG TPA: adenosylcobinamide-GDP ribazoletransferase [Rhizomicrobium sp.]|nr:adenosylcobinamide-GDP ribazoletransferase [Rhizomicrobium sp.]